MAALSRAQSPVMSRLIGEVAGRPSTAGFREGRLRYVSDRPDLRNVVSGSVIDMVVQAGTIDRVVLPRPERLPVPRELPPALRDFTGRDDQLARLDSLLPSKRKGSFAGTAIAVVHGAGGVGKTTLAVHWAHRAQRRFPDGTLFANLRGYGPSSPLDPSVVLASFLQVLGVNQERLPAELDVQVGMFRSLMAGRRMLVVLDNAVTAEQVRPLLPGSAGCLVVITSRANLAGLAVTEAAHQVALDLMTSAEAAELVCGIIGPDRAEAEPDAVADLIRVCARLPLAVRVAATRVALRCHATVADVVADIVDDQSRLAASGAGDAPSAVWTVFDWSYTGLPSEHARVFRRLGLHPGPEFGVQAVAAVAELDVPEAYRHLEALADLHLVEPVGRARYRCHDLLHTYAFRRAELDDPPGHRQRAVARLVTWYARTATEADRLLFPGTAAPEVDLDAVDVPAAMGDREQAWTWLTTEQHALLGTLRAAREHALHGAAILLACAARFLTLRPRAVWPDRLDAETLGLQAARACRDREAELFLLVRRADTLQELRRWAPADADLECALVLAEQLGNPVRLREAWGGLGYSRMAERRYDEAWECYERVIALARAAGSARAEAIAECNLGKICLQLGRYRDALQHADRELMLRHEVGDETGAASALHSAAVAWQRLGEHATAIDLGNRAADLYRMRGFSDHYVARTLELLATSLCHVGQWEQARQALREATGILVALDDPQAEVLTKRLLDLEAKHTSEPG